jgi:hypothetical protein
MVKSAALPPSLLPPLMIVTPLELPIGVPPGGAQIATVPLSMYGMGGADTVIVPPRSPAYCGGIESAIVPAWIVTVAPLMIAGSTYGTVPMQFRPPENTCASDCSMSFTEPTF